MWPRAVTRSRLPCPGLPGCNLGTHDGTTTRSHARVAVGRARRARRFVPPPPRNGAGKSAPAHEEKTGGKNGGQRRPGRRRTKGGRVMEILPPPALSVTDTECSLLVGVGSASARFGNQ